ncbi:MAG: amidohydrolase family protein [Chloroflexota bacterium]
MSGGGGRGALEFWDCHAMVGPATVPPPGGTLDVRGLTAELARAGIGRALAHHGLARDYDAAVGNDLLLQELAGSSSLVPCATLLPPATGELAPLEDLLPGLVAAGVRAVRLYPKSHNFSLAGWCSGALLDALERHQLPLSVDLGETEWDAIHQLCQDYPHLPVIVTRVNYRQERYLYPLWSLHQNLHVEISLFQAHRALEEAVRRFGHQRLLFGTGLPAFDPGAPIMMVCRGEIADEARRAIAGGNLRRLLSAVRAAGSTSAPAIAPHGDGGR